MYENEVWIKKKNKQKNTCYNFRKELFSPLLKESPLTLMHLWYLSTIPSFWVAYFAERLLKGVSWNMFNLSTSGDIMRISGQGGSKHGRRTFGISCEDCYARNLTFRLQ